MSVNGLLKAARQSFKDDDPNYVIYCCDKIIEDFDSKNYFAHIFKGKALHMLKDDEKAFASYEQAAKINSDDVLAWKGMLELARESDNYEQFFRVVTGFANSLLAKNDSLTEVVTAVRDYLKKFKRKVPILTEYYLRQIIPGSEFGDLMGQMFEKPEIALFQLINIVEQKQSAYIKSELFKKKLTGISNMSDKNQLAYNRVITTAHKQFGLVELCERYIDMCSDDYHRKKMESRLLELRFEQLKAAPDAEKKQLYLEVYDMVEGMVVVQSPSQLAWDLYFDWKDLKSFESLDLILVADYIKLFGNVGLGAVLFAFVSSDISPFDRQKVKEYLRVEKKSKKNRFRKKKRVLKNIKTAEEVEEDPNGEAPIAIEESEETTDADDLSPADVLELMIQGIKVASESLLAHRIVTAYYLHLREYETALDYAKQLVTLVSKEQKKLKLDFPNTTKDSLLSLATTYTYYETPRHFSQALKLYDSVLGKSPTDVQARIGKGLILVEQKDYNAAAILLGKVLDDAPDHLQANMEYSWSIIQIGEYAKGREKLDKAYKMIDGTDPNSLEIRGNTLWRIAESYLMEARDTESPDEEHVAALVKSAFDLLIEALKQSESLSAPYSSLGYIYLTYYDNNTRALKCFSKAFELNAGDMLAAKELCNYFSSQKDWEMVEVVCQRVVNSEQGRRAILSLESDGSWPYRMLGCSSLERQDDSKAIELFQNALRIDSADIDSWIGLGEGYLARGRLDAALKVFNKALEIAPDNWHATYLLAVILGEMGEFQDAIFHLETIVAKRPEETCVFVRLAETLVMKTDYEISNSHIARSLDTALKAIETFKVAVKLDPSSPNLCRLVGELLKLTLMVESHIDKLPFDDLNSIFENNSALKTTKLLTEIGDSAEFEALKDSPIKTEATCYFLIQSARIGVSITGDGAPRLLRSSTAYNLGVAYLAAFLKLEKKELQESAIKAFKNAILLENDNPEYWNSLGVASLSQNAKVAQHCFIKASSLSPRDPIPWTHLAVLYMHYGDMDLANQCFLRVQSLAPGQSSCWTGRALVEEANGNEQNASQLLTHAHVMSNGKSPLSMFLYSLSVVKSIVGTETTEENLDAVQELDVANLSILTYLKYYPNDKLALNVAILLIERVHDFSTGLQYSQQLCAILEHKHETDQSDDLVTSLATAKAQISRMYLGAQEYELAIEASEQSMELIESVDGLSDEVQKIMLSSLAVLGLSFFFKGDFDSSVEEFKKILESFPDSQRVVVLIAQVLYDYNSEDTKQAAIDELFNHIESFGSSLLVALTLASISLVEDLEEFYPAIKEELESLSLKQLIDDTSSSVPFFLDLLNQKMDTKKTTIWQRNAILFPSDAKTWKKLNKHVHLNVCLNSKGVGADELSSAYLERGELRGIQRALLLNPSSADGYVALKGCS
ncbi:hypothetical protein OGAPHI_003470 [Ogataea philodendri]|uniref:Superkiller protein 3 n=1 Tax=Ogataea philodendri TaxID=1378263 RepID=A0A9P8P7N6_9ASCO|nr:uncharacterized protein OGAPHI_003470 [Ogataea philodendri]KAH3666474.1 hypothetical protein OGAPHI_003470 [Ogataea philodendri]